MKTRGGFEQCYNGQAAVDVASLLIAGGNVVNAPNNREQLRPLLACVSPVVGKVETMLVDNGYYSAPAMAGIEARGGPLIFAAITRRKHGHSVAELEQDADPPPREGSDYTAVMAWRMFTAQGRARYSMRKQTVEQVFGIINEALEFPRFRLPGVAKANQEWILVMLAYNLKRLWHMGARLRVV